MVKCLRGGGKGKEKVIAAPNISLTFFVTPQNSKPNFLKHTEKKLKPLFRQFIRTNLSDLQCRRLEKLDLV